MFVNCIKQLCVALVNFVYCLGKNIDGEVLFSLNSIDVDTLIPVFGLKKKFYNRLPANHLLASAGISKNQETSVSLL